MKYYVTKNEISFDKETTDMEDIARVVKTMMDNGYVCMLSYEDDLVILNYEWSYNECDRNDMVFMSREDFEMLSYDECDKCCHMEEEEEEEECEAEDKEENESSYNDCFHELWVKEED